MFGPKKSGPIRSRVFQVIEERIKEGEAKFFELCMAIEDSYHEALSKASEDRSTSRTAAQDKIVSDIVGK